jgi:hypothetical protein
MGRDGRVSSSDRMWIRGAKLKKFGEKPVSALFHSGIRYAELKKTTEILFMLCGLLPKICTRNLPFKKHAWRLVGTDRRMFPVNLMQPRASEHEAEGSPTQCTQLIVSAPFYLQFTSWVNLFVRFILLTHLGYQGDKHICLAKREGIYMLSWQLSLVHEFMLIASRLLQWLG